MKKQKIKLFFLCLICGIVFLCIGIYFTSKTNKFKEYGVQTQAEIVLIESNYNADDEEDFVVYVKYTVNNTTYTSNLDYYSNRLRECDIITILYLPDNPLQITYPKFNTVPQILFFGSATICIVVGLFNLISTFVKKTTHINTVRWENYPTAVCLLLNLFVFIRIAYVF